MGGTGGILEGWKAGIKGWNWKGCERLEAEMEGLTEGAKSHN